MATPSLVNEAVYVHDIRDHPLLDAQLLLPLVLERLRPKSVIDVGCGIGTFLHVCKDLGISQVLGVDGDWVDRDLLFGHISPDEFRVVDLTSGTPLVLPRHDLAICLEVAEHLDESHAAALIGSLVATSDCVLFSAAIPGQGGQRHVNERWPEYWAAQFASHGYAFADVIRPMIWNEPRISFWYRQNCFLAVRSDKRGGFSGSSQRGGQARKRHSAWSTLICSRRGLLHTGRGRSGSSRVV